MEKYVKSTVSFLKHQYLPHILAVFLLFAAAGGILSFRNLDARGAARVMEMYGILSGILLFTPIFMPEADTEIWQLEQSKTMPMWKLYLGRLLLAFFVQAVTISAFILRLMQGNSVFPAQQLWRGSFGEAVFLGSLGFFCGGVSNQAVIGYMVSVLYFVGNLGGSEYFGRLGLTSMTKGRYDTWGWFLAAALLLFVSGVFLRERKR